MGRHFEIESKLVNNNLHIRLKGDLDGSTAMQLVDALNVKYSGAGRVYIDTHELGSILPFGVKIFHNQLNPGRLPLDRLFFIGQKGIALAPKGCKVIVAGEKHTCRCNGKCTECRCSAKTTTASLNRYQEQ
jgi:hypothetical protein